MTRRIISAGSLIAACLAAAPAFATSEFGDIPVITVVLNGALERERNGVEVTWSNPETGNNGIVIIERTFYLDPQTPCRDYRRTTERAGAPPSVVLGTGCRSADGHWRLDERRDREPETAPPPASVETARLPESESAADVDEPTPLWTAEPEVKDPAESAAAVPPEPAPEPAVAPAPPQPRARPTPPPVVVTASLPSKSDE